MAGFVTTMPGYSNINRSNLYSAQLKDFLEDELLGMQFVTMLTD